jgi:hypothetical protein
MLGEFAGESRFPKVGSDYLQDLLFSVLLHFVKP